VHRIMEGWANWQVCSFWEHRRAWLRSPRLRWQTCSARKDAFGMAFQYIGARAGAADANGRGRDAAALKLPRFWRLRAGPFLLLRRYKARCCPAVQNQHPAGAACAGHGLHARHEKIFHAKGLDQGRQADARPWSCNWNGGDIALQPRFLLISLIKGAWSELTPGISRGESPSMRKSEAALITG